MSVNTMSSVWTKIMALMLLMGLSLALPYPEVVEDESAGLFEKRTIQNGIGLKIMPIGASITWGLKSFDGNGYRLKLQNLLTQNGNQNVTFVGTQHSGNMTYPSTEGYPGLVVTEVSDKLKADQALQNYLPNVALINLGTNNCQRPSDPDSAPAQMSDLIDYVYSSVPNIVVILSTLVPNKDHDDCIVKLNSGLKTVATNKINAGRKLVLVDFHGSNWSINDIGPDGIHPTDAGYTKMAQGWFTDGFTKVGAKNWFTKADPKGQAPFKQ